MALIDHLCYVHDRQTLIDKRAIETLPELTTIRYLLFQTVSRKGDVVGGISSHQAFSDCYLALASRVLRDRATGHGHTCRVRYRVRTNAPHTARTQDVPLTAIVASSDAILRLAVHRSHMVYVRP